VDVRRHLPAVEPPCIYGEGCEGILDGPAAEMAQGCCSYGAHFVDDDDVQTVVRAFVRLEPRHMQFHAKARRGGFLRPGDPDAEGNPPPRPGSSTTRASS
jgi:hypothetical protein